MNKTAETQDIAVLTIYNAGYIILFQTVRLHHPVFKQNQGCFFEKKKQAQACIFCVKGE